MYIQRISLELPESISNARNDPKHGRLLCATRHNELHENRSPCFGCSLSGTSNFSLKIPIFDPVDPKFDPQTCTLVYKHKKKN